MKEVGSGEKMRVVWPEVRINAYLRVGSSASRKKPDKL